MFQQESTVDQSRLIFGQQFIEQPYTFKSGHYQRRDSFTGNIIISGRFQSGQPSGTWKYYNQEGDYAQYRYQLERCGARCMDGTTSSATGRGACSWHGGVQQWLYKPVKYFVGGTGQFEPIQSRLRRIKQQAYKQYQIKKSNSADQDQYKFYKEAIKKHKSIHLANDIIEQLQGQNNQLKTQIQNHNTEIEEHRTKIEQLQLENKKLIQKYRQIINRKEQQQIMKIGLVNSQANTKVSQIKRQIDEKILQPQQEQQQSQIKDLQNKFADLTLNQKVENQISSILNPNQSQYFNNSVSVSFDFGSQFPQMQSNDHHQQQKLEHKNDDLLLVTKKEQQQQQFVKQNANKQQGSQKEGSSEDDLQSEKSSNQDKDDDEWKPEDDDDWQSDDEDDWQSQDDDELQQAQIQLQNKYSAQRLQILMQSAINKLNKQTEQTS